MKKILTALITCFIALSFAAPSEAAKPKRILPPTIIAAGDSITQGVGAPAGWDWPSRLQFYSGATVTNVGHGGSCLVFTGCGYGPTLLQTFDSEVLAKSPAATIVAPGRNDFCHVTTDVMIDAILRLRGRARNAGVQFYVATVTPAGAAWPWPCEDQRRDYNNRLRQMPNVLDFESVIKNQNDRLPWKYDSGDGLHLNAGGYDALGAFAAVYFR